MESIIIKNLQKIREKVPLVHSITNYVVMNNTANALLALGASPLMAHAHSEIEDIVQLSGSLVVNIGTLDEYWTESMKMAAAHAHKIKKTWVLDPVGAGASPYRDAVLKELLQFEPDAIRGNASEIMALANTNLQSKGVDSMHKSSEALQSALLLAQQNQTVVCISGAVDFITDGQKTIQIENGSPLMAKVTGMGCTATAIIGACISVSENTMEGVVAAMAIMAIAGEMAAEKAGAPGTFQVEFYNALYNITEGDIRNKLKIQ